MRQRWQKMYDGKLIRLPKTFFRDHDERCRGEVPIPKVVRETKMFVWVRLDDPGMADLINDAEFYADETGFGPEERKTYCRSAQRLLAAYQTQYPADGDEQ